MIVGLPSLTRIPFKVEYVLACCYFLDGLLSCRRFSRSDRRFSRPDFLLLFLISLFPGPLGVATPSRRVRGSLGVLLHGVLLLLLGDSDFFSSAFTRF